EQPTAAGAIAAVAWVCLGSGRDRQRPRRRRAGSAGTARAPRCRRSMPEPQRPGTICKHAELPPRPPATDPPLRSGQVTAIGSASVVQLRLLLVVAAMGPWLPVLRAVEPDGKKDELKAYDARIKPKDREHWSFKPIHAPEPPLVKNAAWVRN